MRRLVYAFFYLVLVLLGLVFTALNQDPVTLDYHVGRFEMPLAALVISAVLLGVVISLMICSGSKFRAQIEIRKLCKKIDNLEQEIENLRKPVTKDPH